MGGGPIIIIDPNKVVSKLSTEETIALLRDTLDDLETGAISVESASLDNGDDE
jgi:hypothetical protein